MCAIEAGKRQRKVLVLDHANRAGKKILMSGGGRCNFTNMVRQNIEQHRHIRSIASADQFASQTTSMLIVGLMLQ